MSDAGSDLTTVHVRKAIDGDRESLSWIVERFSPLLLAQARYRLGRDRGTLCEPDDLVNDVWITALPKLPELPAREGRFTPVVLRFLSTTLLNHYSNLMKRRLREQRDRVEGPSSSGGEFADETRGVVTRVLNAEACHAVSDAIEGLEPLDREVVILRGIEQNPSSAVAAVTGLTENAIHVRYHRALKKLQGRLQGTVIDELPQ